MIPGWGVTEEAQWMLENPAFDERPASMPEFLGPDYMDIDKYVRPGVRKILVDIFGEVPNGKNPSQYGKAMFTGGIGVGKEISFSTKVLTPDGWRRAGDIRVGDYLIGSNGLPTKVLRLFHPGVKPFYRMHFKDGSYADSCEDHMWAVDEYGTHSSEGKRWRGVKRHVWDTKTIAQKNLKVGKTGSWRYRIPLPSAVQFSSADSLPIPAYSLGALIANGSLTGGSIRISTENTEIVERMSEELDGVEMKAYPANSSWCIGSPRTDSGRYEWGHNPVMSALRDLGMWGVGSKDKTIPAVYMTASIQDRLDLLRGIMDGDGCSTKSQAARLSTISFSLVESVVELVRSLGGYATWNSSLRKRSGVMEYEVHVSIPDTCPFWLRKKAEIWHSVERRTPVRSIIALEEIEASDGVCFQVDADDSLFIMDQYVLTHNSTFAAISLAYLCHWTLCLRDPQEFFDLMPGSRISFMMMSTSADNARGVIFDDVKGRIENSPWFRDKYPYDEKWDRQIRFPQKGIYILPGGSNPLP